MTNKVAIDFDRVESLREHMLLSVADMATLFGVSRQTYYHWINGGNLRPRSADKVRDTLRQLLFIVKAGHWPTADARNLTQKQRHERLLEILDIYT